MNTGRAAPTGASVETVSPTELYEVVAGAASQDPATLQASAKRLKQMTDTMSGTFDGLQEIAAQKSIPLPIRQQSIIQFKNAALNHWKSRKLLSDDHRARIRARCMSFMDEEDDLIAECNEFVVAKIARQDFPTQWPNLTTDLVSIIDINLQQRYSSPIEEPKQGLILRRGLRLLNGILREFGSFKMLQGVRTMGQIVEQLSVVLTGYYSQISSCFSAPILNAQSISTTRIRDDILLGHLTYKCVVKLAVWLWNRLDKSGSADIKKHQPWLSDLFQNSVAQLRALNEARTQLVITINQAGQSTEPSMHRSVDALTRHVLCFGKFFRRLQQLSHPRFVTLPMCNDVVLYYWSQVVQATSGPHDLIADSNHAVYPIRFLVQAMVLFKDNLAQWTPRKRDGTPNPNALSRDFVEDAVKLLVTRFMPLNPKDLESWTADPEEWANIEDKDDEQWQFEIRPCSERVLMQLGNQYTDIVTPLLDASFKQMAAEKTVELADVIQKEALYCAVGRCARHLKDTIPFDQWLNHSLIPEARDTNPNYPIIKRRIAWVIGKWVHDECASPNNSQIWDVLVHLVQDHGPGTDAVVRFAAASALQQCIDMMDFDINVFAPYLQTVVAEMARIIGEAETFETKRKVAGSLNVVIEQAGTRMVPFMGVVTELIPQLWSSAGDNYLLKATLLSTVQNLVQAVRDQSTGLGGIVVPLIRESLSPAFSVYLDADAMELWLTALRNTLTTQSVNGAPALFELFPLAMTMLATNMDLLGKLTDIAESYILLDGMKIMQTYAGDIFTPFLTVLRNDVMVTNKKDALQALNILVQVTPANMWGEPMHISGLFAHLLSDLIAAEGDTGLHTEQIYLFSRMILSDRQIFLQLMSATATMPKLNEHDLYEGLLDQWWGKFDNMSEPRHRKLTAMGIASLVATGRPEVLQRLPGEIFNLWLDVLGEIKEALKMANERGSPGSSPVLSPLNLARHWEHDEAPPYYYKNTDGTTEYERRQAVFNADPIRTIKLSAYVGDCIRQAEAITGSQNFQVNYLAKTDPTVLKQIQDELARGG